MNPQTTAIVLIEFQNEFCAEGGALYPAVKDVIEQNHTLTNAQDLIERARGKVQLIYVPITFSEGYNEINAHPYGILKGVVDATAFVKGTWGADFYEPLKPHEGDIIVEGKRGLCAMASTNLDFILRSRGITTVALGGFLTNVCVESTMRTAYERGYDVITLTDCTGATSIAEQEFTVAKNYPLFSRPLTHDQFLAELEAGAEGRELTGATAGGRGYYTEQ